MHELKVAYELLLDAKRHKMRIDDMVLALQDSSRTPPGGSSPRIVGLGTSPSTGKNEHIYTSEVILYDIIRLRVEPVYWNK